MASNRHSPTDNKLLVTSTGLFLASGWIMAFFPKLTDRSGLAFIYDAARVILGSVATGFEAVTRWVTNNPRDLMLNASDDVFFGSLIFVLVCALAGFGIGWAVQRFAKPAKWFVLCVLLTANALVGLVFSWR